MDSNHILLRFAVEQKCAPVHRKSRRGFMGRSSKPVATNLKWMYRYIYIYVYVCICILYIIYYILDMYCTWSGEQSISGGG